MYMDKVISGMCMRSITSDIDTQMELGHCPNANYHIPYTLYDASCTTNTNGRQPLLLLVKTAVKLIPCWPHH